MDLSFVFVLAIVAYLLALKLMDASQYLVGLPYAGEQT
jgi:hypothetical protein